MVLRATPAAALAQLSRATIKAIVADPAHAEDRMDPYVQELAALHPTFAQVIWSLQDSWLGRAPKAAPVPELVSVERTYGSAYLREDLSVALARAVVGGLPVPDGVSPTLFRQRVLSVVSAQAAFHVQKPLKVALCELEEGVRRSALPTTRETALRKWASAVAELPLELGALAVHRLIDPPSPKPDRYTQGIWSPEERSATIQAALSPELRLAVAPLARAAFPRPKPPTPVAPTSPTRRRGPSPR
jgi:hypothetical protein